MPLGESLQQRWYENRAPPWWTLPIAALFGAVTHMRRAAYKRGWLRSERLPVPVIVIGNITVGGAGKTPLTIALVEALRARGFKPGVVSRGYGGLARVPMLLDDEPDPRVVGDEPALIKLRTRAPVAIGRDRALAAKLLMPAGVNVVIADDGLQHYALARDVEICVIDGARRFGNARLLPAGPLREPLARLREMDFIVCNGAETVRGDASTSSAQGSLRESNHEHVHPSIPQGERRNEIPMHLHADQAISLRDPSITRTLESFAGQRVHAVAGIGHPARFFAMLRERRIEAIEHPFPDHHAYTPRDLVFGDELPILMTEKDAVKCRACAGANAWSVPVAASLPQTFFDEIMARLARTAAIRA